MKTFTKYYFLICFLNCFFLYSGGSFARSEKPSEYPKESKIIFNGHTGCIAPLQYTLSLVQKGGDAAIYFIDIGSVKFNKGARRDISFEEFKAFWHKFIALDPMNLSDNYVANRNPSTNSFLGTLEVEYTIGENSYRKKAEITGIGWEDERMNKIHSLLLGLVSKSDDATASSGAQIQNGLKIVLTSAKEKFNVGEEVLLDSVFENVGEKEISLTFWWDRKLIVRDLEGNAIAPGKGPELPCGIPEIPEVLLPGKTVSRQEPLACTQPSGVSQSIGWSYDLGPGTYKIALILESPPAHGYGVNRAKNAWNGKVISNEVIIAIGE